MAYIEPKTNWVATNIPVASDLNRIEGNTKQNHDDIASGLAAEEAARIADVDAEEAERIASDALNLPGATLGIRSLTTISVTEDIPYIVPPGSYYYATTAGIMQIQTSLGWKIASIESSGFIISDGVNIRLLSGTSDATLELVKIF